MDVKEMYEEVLGQIDEDMMRRGGNYLTYFENAKGYEDEFGEDFAGDKGLYQEDVRSQYADSSFDLELDEPFIVLDNESSVGGYIYTHEDSAEKIISFMKSEPKFARCVKGTPERAKRRRELGMER